MQNLGIFVLKKAFRSASKWIRILALMFCIYFDCCLCLGTKEEIRNSIHITTKSRNSIQKTFIVHNQQDDWTQKTVFSEDNRRYMLVASLVAEFTFSWIDDMIKFFVVNWTFDWIPQISTFQRQNKRQANQNSHNIHISTVECFVWNNIAVNRSLTTLTTKSGVWGQRDEMQSQRTEYIYILIW